MRLKTILRISCLLLLVATLGGLSGCGSEHSNNIELLNVSYDPTRELWRELNDKNGLVETLLYLGYALKRLGNGTGAYAHFEEALAIVREENWSHFYVAGCLGLLGNTAGDLGRWEEAAARCAEGLRLTRCGANAQDRLNIAWTLTGLARVALARGRPARAAHMLAPTAALWDSVIRLSRPPDFEQAVAAARAQMDLIEFEAAWAEGRAKPLQAVVAAALGEASAG